MPVEVIDTSKFDKQEENEKMVKQEKTKVKNLQTTNEAKRKFNDKIITNPFLGQKKQPSEAKKLQEVAQLEKMYEELEAKKIKTESIQAQSESVKIIAEKNEVVAFLEIEEQLEEFSQTEIASQTREGINNIIVGGVYRDPIKKELLKRNLTNNLLIQRSNNRLSFNLLNRMPLILQYPLFVGMEIVKTEDQYKNLVINHQRMQQTQVKEEKPKEEEKKD